MGLFINTSHFTDWNDLENETFFLPDEESMERILVRGMRCPEHCNDSLLWTNLGEASGSLIVGPKRSSFYEINISFTKIENTVASTIMLDKLEFDGE